MVLRAKEYFVDEHSIVREIWGKSDTILFIFAGAAAEFALNKSVDWLYFTGRLPADPLGRLFSTISYAKKIVFSEKQTALSTIDSMAAIHAQVEQARGAKIPDWAYRDVLFMLIDYSIRAFEMLEHKLSNTEKCEVFDVFNKMGTRMGLKGLPDSFDAWLEMRQKHLEQNLQPGKFTKDLFHQYRKHLGWMRYKILLDVQANIVPDTVSKMLQMRRCTTIQILLFIYRLTKYVCADRFLRSLILPSRYVAQINALDR